MRVGDARLLDRLVRGRSWIALMAIGLIGIVFMQVSLLKLNAGISRAVTAADTLERQNSNLRGEISNLDSGERVQDVAAKLGMITPAAGDVHYLDARQADGARAAAAIKPPAPVAGAGATGTSAPSQQPRGATQRQPRRRHAQPATPRRSPRRRRARGRDAQRPSEHDAASPRRHDDPRRDDRARPHTTHSAARGDGTPPPPREAQAPSRAGLAGGAARAPHRPPLRRVPRLLLLAAGRALFLGTVKGSSLASAAASQQVSSLSCRPGAARSSTATASSSRSPSPPTTSRRPRTWSRIR
jgi:cell division protein FtsL